MATYMIQLCVVSVIKVHKSLPAEKDLTYQTAVEIARGVESAPKSTQ